MSQRSASSNQIDAMVADSVFRATDAILQDRRATLRPITSQASVEWPDYVRHVLTSWKSNVTTPLTLDLYIHLPRSNEHVLLERWQFAYALQSDLKDTKPFAMINRRVQTLLRSLYCFVRMLPGFNMLHQCLTKPLISFQLYAEQRTIPSAFKHEVSRYQFAKVSTSKGLIAISVTFLNSTPVKAHIKSINSSVSAPNTNTSSTPQPIRRDSMGQSPTMPIPIASSAGAYENAGGYMRTRTDSRDFSLHRRSFNASDNAPIYSRSFEAKTPILSVDASPFRPNDASHLYAGLRNSPGTGLSPGQFMGTPSIPIPGTGTRSAASTPHGSTPPFAFRTMMEERSSDGSMKEMIAQSPPFPPTSSSLTSTSFNSHAFNLPERRNSFRRDSIAIANSVGVAHIEENVMSKPSQLLLPEWEMLRQRLVVPSFPLAPHPPVPADTVSKLDIVLRMEKEKEKRRGSFDALRISSEYPLGNAVSTRISSDGMRDDFFERLREERTSFFGDQDDDLPFAVHHSELTGAARPTSRSQSVGTGKSAEALLAEFQSQLQAFKQLAITHQHP